MKQMKILSVVTIALALGLTACGGKKECSKHSWGEWAITKENTCTEPGEQVRKCKVCGKEDTKTIAAAHKFGEWSEVTPASCSEEGLERRVCERCQEPDERPIDKLPHTYAKDAEGNDVVVWSQEADCTNAGVGVKTCTVCGEDEDVNVQALGHVYAKVLDAEGNETNEDLVVWSKEATCTEGGVGTKECTRCHQPTNVTAEKLGHHLVPVADDGTPAPADEAKVRVFECDRDGCDYITFGFKAVETSSNSGRLVEEPVLDAEGNPTGEVGKRFWGRPIGNAMELGEDGSASGASAEKIFDRTVQGDLFEYKFTLTQDQINVLGDKIVCYADAKPADYLNGQDFWACDPTAEEWTPGYYIDADHEDQVAIADYRYILYVDDQPVQFDSTMTAPVPRNGMSSTNLPRAEFLMPYVFEFAAGQHKISLRMAGGYRSIFYNFIFRPYEAPEVPPVPAHVHDFSSETDVSAKGEGYVGYKTATCSEENAKRINIRALDGTFGENSANKTGNGAPLEGYMKLAGNKQSISYKFDYAGQAATAKLYQYGYMDNFSSNGDRTYTSAQNSANLSDSPTGTNFAVKFNNADVAISDATKATTYTNFFQGATVSPGGSGNSNLAACYIGDVQLQNGDNTFIFTRYESFNLSVSNFYLVIE